MKKITLAILAIFIATSCEKTTTDPITPMESANFATIMNSDAKQSSQYFASITVGHLASHCGNSCVTSGGFTGHVDCQGYGTSCQVTASIALSLNINTDSYQAVTLNTYDLTSEDFFLMPDRSLFVELVNGGKEELWLNIPEQLAVRDSVTELFTFYDLFFTSYPVYKNQ